MGVRIVIPWPTAAFFAGLIGSLLATRLVQEIDWGHRFHAVGLEIAATAVGILALQIWHAKDGDWRVLAIEGAGTVLGTFAILSL